jgi:dimethylargininase
VTHIERVPVDLELAKLQWQGYTEAMASNGWDLVVVPPAHEGWP